MKRTLLLVAGTISLILGIVGIFVPILPTTPFLLLAAACYVRSSARMYHWLLNNRFLGTYIRNYLQGRGMSLRQKVFTLVLLWVAIGMTAWLATQIVIIRVILILVAAGVTAHLIRIKTLTETDNQGQSDEG